METFLVSPIHVLLQLTCSNAGSMVAFCNDTCHISTSILTYSLEVVSKSLIRKYGDSSRANALLEKNNIHISVSSSDKLYPYFALLLLRDVALGFSIHLQSPKDDSTSSKSHSILLQWLPKSQFTFNAILKIILPNRLNDFVQTSPSLIQSSQRISTIFFYLFLRII